MESCTSAAPFIQTASFPRLVRKVRKLASLLSIHLLPVRYDDERQKHGGGEARRSLLSFQSDPTRAHFTEGEAAFLLRPRGQCKGTARFYEL